MKIKIIKTNEIIIYTMLTTHNFIKLLYQKFLIAYHTFMITNKMMIFSETLISIKFCLAV